MRYERIRNKSFYYVEIIGYERNACIFHKIRPSEHNYLYIDNDDFKLIKCPMMVVRSKRLEQKKKKRKDRAEI